MDGHVCTNCRWWDKPSGEGFIGSNPRRCMVNSPTVFPVKGKNYTRWPETKPDDRCSDWDVVIR